MAILELKDVSFGYCDTQVVAALSLVIEEGQILSIMGPSGCGKSTVLRLLAGLDSAGSGTRLFNGKPMNEPSPELRFSFQDFDSFPWRTVRQNLLLGGARCKGSGNAFDVDELLQSIGLAAHAKKYPAELSGGMRKRLGLGRCLEGKPRLILLDEPFSSLDVDARQEMYELLQSLWSEWQCVFVIVTHDIHEAIVLSQKVLISHPLPFRVKEVVDVPLDYPRAPSVARTRTYLSLTHRIRQLL